MFFIQYAFENPLYYFSIVLLVMLSIILHELAHGWTALWQGDDTPRITGHMTIDPLVHMTGVGFFLLVFVGIAFGAMPVNPRNFRSRHGHAYVAFAGPAMNLLLVFVFLGLATAVNVLQPLDPEVNRNLLQVLAMGSVLNMILAIFNMLPIPPLDGFTVLATTSRGFRRFASTGFLHQYGLLLLIVLLWGANLDVYLFGAAFRTVNFLGSHVFGFVPFPAAV